MNPGEQAIQSLRAALQVSPDNLPLQLHLAETLCSFGRFDEAEFELRQALSRNSSNDEVKLALCKVYIQQAKSSQAAVILEEMIGHENASGAAHVAYAKLLFGEGDIPNAVAQYKLGIEKDSDAGDDDLGEQLGVGGANSQSEVVEGRVRDGWRSAADKEFDTEQEFDTEIERPGLKFDDVGGMDELKEEIKLKILYPLQHPEIYESYGKEIGGGILLYGPPGCGKTYLARATAGEIGAGFISVGISDVLDMWTGQSERNLAQVFQNARDNQPCVLFFDEVDALGGRRSDMISGSGRHLINQFLSEMDGVEKSNKGVLILAATNAPWHVDPAFRRPGRFDRILFVPPPDDPARASIMQIHLRNKPQKSVDYIQIAKKTEKFSGADLKAVVDQSIEAKLRDAMKTGIPQPLSTKDLLAACKSIKPSTREWFSTARNYALYSNQGGAYDDVLKYLKM